MHPSQQERAAILVEMNALIQQLFDLDAKLANHGMRKTLDDLRQGRRKIAIARNIFSEESKHDPSLK